MNCKEIQQNIDDLEAEQPEPGYAEALQKHLDGCQACQAFYNDTRRIKKTLRNAELPPLPQSIRQMRYVQNNQPAHTLRWLAAAALLLITFSLGFFVALNTQQDTPAPPATSRITQTVVMAVESVNDRQGVTLRLLLPPGVEVDGHPGAATLEWRDDLSAGINRLRIPLILSGDEDGMLIAQVEYQGKIQEIRVRLGKPTEAPQTKTGEKSPRRVT